MRNFKRPGIWLGIIAVFLGLGGSAFAASKITSAQIKDGTITGRDIKRNSIGSAQLTDEAESGLVGDPGPAGPQGPAGAPGPAGMGGVQIVESAHFALAPGQYSPVNANAVCPAGKVVIGTGFYGSIAHVSFVKAYGNLVGGFIYNDASVTANDLHFQAICASSGGAVASSASRRNAQLEADHKQAVARIACTSAKIGGAKKCIARGQFCAVRNQRDYKRHGFTCKKDKAGRYRLS